MSATITVQPIQGTSSLAIVTLGAMLVLRPTSASGKVVYRGFDPVLLHRPEAGALRALHSAGRALEGAVRI